MGGLHSGRKRQHVCINDCLEIDTTWLKKRKLLQPGTSHSFTIIWRMWHETNFKKRAEQEYKVNALISLSGDSPTLTLAYQAGHEGKSLEDHKHVLMLESTPCNYGGQRWWFQSPCCGRRVRVLYINLRQANIDDVTPQCRDCQELHYPSQLASYQERHATYERYLLSNFGDWWAEDEYRFMPEHHFKITPEWAYKAERAQVISRLKTMKLLIRCERYIMKSRITTLKKLSVEGRREYFEYLANDPEKAEELAEYQHLANILIASRMIPADNQDQGDQVAELPNTDQSQGDDLPVDDVVSLQLIKWMARKDEIEQELQELEALAA